MAQNHIRFDLKALQQGEPSAIEDWFEHFSNQLYAFAY